MSVRTSMYRMVFALIVLPFLLFSLVITNLYSSILENIIADSLRVVADAQVAEMANFCEQQKEYLEFIGTMDLSHAAMRSELAGDMNQYLDNVLLARVQTLDYLNTLAIIDNKNRVVACSAAHTAFANEGIDNVLQAMKGQPFHISDVLTDAKGQKLLVATARIEEGGQTLGYILAEINLDFYSAIRERAELWNDSTFYLLDGRGQIVSAGTQNEKRESFVTSAQEREDYNEKYSAIDFEKEPEGSFCYTMNENSYITYYSDVAYTDWRVLLSVNLSNYQSKETVYFVLACSMVLLCILLAIWIGRFASKRIIHPIKSISGTLQNIRQEQDYTLRVAVERKDELGSLAGEVNELLDFIETENLYKTQQQRLLQAKAEQDALTKVLNKERIDQVLQEAIERHRADRTPMAVLFVDVDDFKDFNTQYGHNVGDQVLLYLTSKLAQQTGGTVGRVGGDEFLVIMEAPEQLASLDAFLNRLEEPSNNQFVVRGSGARLYVYCSIGAVRIDFAQSGMENLTSAQVTERADAAMYQAKHGGKHGHEILDYTPPDVME